MSEEPSSKNSSNSSSDSSSDSSLSSNGFLKELDYNLVDGSQQLAEEDSSNDSSSDSSSENSESTDDSEGQTRKKIPRDSRKLNGNDFQSSEEDFLNKFTELVDNHFDILKKFGDEKDNFTPGQDNVSDGTLISNIASTSRCDSPFDTPIQSTSPVISFYPVYQTFENGNMEHSNNSEEFDFFTNYKKNERKFRQHPYPGSVPIQKRKAESGKYFRYEKKISTLYYKAVESALKEAEKKELLVSRESDDAFKLEHYPVVSEEIECFSRILSSD